MILIDEISMVGRQFMGKIDSRLKQGKAGEPNADESLGGLSCVCVGDPAQCEALKDQQIYDVNPHRQTASDEVPECALHSNIGLSVYSEFDDVIILSTVHRLRFIEKETMTQEEIEYNERATRCMNTLHKLRDLRWNLEDYYWLCKRKRSMLPPSERARFTDAPYIMDFRKDTDANPEDNCNYFNRIRLRRHAEEHVKDIASFEAYHKGISQEEGAKLDEEKFKGLAQTLELAEDARVILTHNLVPEQGLMNGTQGSVKKIVYDHKQGPGAHNLEDRMPKYIVVDFPQYVGTPFYDTEDYPERRTWVPLEPREIRQEGNEGVSRVQFPIILA